MRRRRKYDVYLVIFLAIFTTGYFVYNHMSAESRGIKSYAEALKLYKNADYELAYQYFGKVPSGSTLKMPALFRQARCATNMDKKELAIKKYNRIVHSRSKSTIAPISEYNMANLMFEVKDDGATRHFKKIIKKFPTSNYAIASNYYLGLIEILEPPETDKILKKSNEKAFNYFKTYIEEAPDGRFALNSIEEIKKLQVKTTNYDNLIIAKSYYANGKYEQAKEYLNKTSIAESWSDFAKNEYKLGNIDKGNYYTELGLKKYLMTTANEDIYEVIDLYVSSASSRSEGIKKILSLLSKGNSVDYIEYLNCNEVVGSSQKEACYRTFYEKYPNGQFSADSLYNVFMSKYREKRFYDAQRLGYLHLKKFPEVNSTPAVMYFMGKIAFKLKHYESASNYYKQVLERYPDSYYAFRANFNLYQEDGLFPFSDLKSKAVVFPYKKSLDNNLVVKLAYLGDLDLVEELCKQDKFIQSWIAYEKGKYTTSIVLARNAMKDLSVKPAFDDLRWRLVYPIHYYSDVQKVKGHNNPIILESIIKEESHFDPTAKSSVGATGLMQLMPATFKEAKKLCKIPDNLGDEFLNITAGSCYYGSLMNALGHNDVYAIAAYNGGIGSVTRWFPKKIYAETDEFVEHIPYPETKNYVKKVLRTYWMYGNIY